MDLRKLGSLFFVLPVILIALLLNHTRFTYDALGRLATVIDNNNVTAEQYTYTANGLQATFIDARGNTTKTSYDGFDRPSQTTYAFGTGLASSESFTFDALDNLKRRLTRKGDTISFDYDTLNRLITKTPPAGSPMVNYKYDLAGRITGVSDTSANITAAVPPTGTSVQYATSTSYDQLNRPTNVTWSPVVTAATPTTSNVTFTHGYNQANQRTSQAANDITWLHYPTTASSTSYTANALNQYTAVGATTPTYDNNGNLTYDGVFTLGYDVENRLTSASGAGNTVTYAYDSQGRRKRKTVNAANAASSAMRPCTRASQGSRSARKAVEVKRRRRTANGFARRSGAVQGPALETPHVRLAPPQLVSNAHLEMRVSASPMDARAIAVS